MTNNLVEALLYKNEESAVSINVVIDQENETMWATQKTIAELFNVNVPAISKHLKNIFNEGELTKNSVISKMETTANDGKKYNTNFYNLDAIISVGYRVNSKEATQFRKWATKILREYMVKGFALDIELLKNGSRFGKDYFDELLEKIKEIRASERRVYQKITDIFKECSWDYDKDSEIAREFYSKVQNKLHYAITGQTAAEIINERADHTKKHMGLTTWNNAPDGKILKSDIIVAKNYLDEEELSELNNIVNMYLDYAENQARRHKLMSMEDWAIKLDKFLEFNEYELLENKGKISKNKADNKANNEYEQFRIIQDREYISDFDKIIEDVKKLDK
ncbi:virulence RhuM family protein [Methanobrevibacter woesei]|uniref:virulence RhuM family protein n=1 Tax=Methanobrevibacter woesei TaxID=190976 RepID=UPI0024B6D5E8|nr:virulence RhuM family protein [Methanobrevibacter woesei]